ncbi:DUF554 domain-containing protein [Aerococcaceae bacterium WGS1372]
MGAIVNAVVIVICAIVGVQLRTGIPERVQASLMQGVGLCVLALGISGAIQGQNTLVMILSIVIGTLCGEWIDIDRHVLSGVEIIEQKLNKNGIAKFGNLSQGMISASMIFCIGSMAIVGSLESGLIGDNSTLFTKSILDGITSILLGSSLGIGVALSAIPVLIIQGSITILAIFIEPLLSEAVITEIISVGSVLLLGLGLNIIGVTQFKIMNFVPAIILPVLLMLFI